MPRNHKQNRATLAARHPAPPPQPSKLRPAAAEYVRTPRIAPAAAHLRLAPPRCPAASSAVQRPPAVERFRPAAAQTETICLRGLQPKQNELLDDRARSVHRKTSDRAYLRRSQPAVISRAYKFGAVKKSIARRALSLLPPRLRWPASHRNFPALRPCLILPISLLLIVPTRASAGANTPT